MAVDTQEKRMAASGAGRPWMRGALPGTNDQEYRVSRGIAYGGNEITSTAVIVVDEVGGGSSRKRSHGAVILPPRPREDVYPPVQPGLTDDELAALAVLCIDVFYD